MKILKTVAATLAALAVTAPVLAAPVGVHENNPHRDILDHIREGGIDVVTEHELCEGRHGFFGVVDGRITLAVCTESIDSFETLFRTIRHEAVHVAQMCKHMIKGAPANVDAYALLNPSRNEYYLDRAQDNGWHILGYEPRDWDIEAEAWVLSNTLTAEEITQLLNTNCTNGK
jgi:hypothetical protein